MRGSVVRGHESIDAVARPVFVGRSDRRAVAFHWLGRLAAVGALLYIVLSILGFLGVSWVPPAHIPLVESVLPGPAPVPEINNPSAVVIAPSTSQQSASQPSTSQPPTSQPPTDPPAAPGSVPNPTPSEPAAGSGPGGSVPASANSTGQTARTTVPTPVSTGNGQPTPPSPPTSNPGAPPTSGTAAPPAATLPAPTPVPGTAGGPVTQPSLPSTVVLPTTPTAPATRPSAADPTTPSTADRGASSDTRPTHS